MTRFAAGASVAVPVHSRTATTRCQKRRELPEHGQSSRRGRAGHREPPQGQRRGWSPVSETPAGKSIKSLLRHSTGPLCAPLPETLNMQNHKSEIRELTAGTALLLDNLTSPNTEFNGFFPLIYMEIFLALRRNDLCSAGCYSQV